MDLSVLCYLFPALFAFLGMGVYDLGGRSKGKKVIWVFLYVYLVCLMGFRFEVGGDTLTYMSWFDYAKPLSRWKPFDISNLYEPGFTFIVACIKEVGGDFVHFQIVHAIIINTCIFYYISRKATYRFSALLCAFLIYYIYFSTEILREAIAIFIFVLNFDYFIKRSWVKYYITVVICIFFHLSSCFLLALPLLVNLKFNYTFFLFGIAFITVCFALQPLFRLVSYVMPAVGAKAESYGQHSYVGYFWAALRVFQFSIIPLLVIFVSKKILKISIPYEISYLILILLGIGILFVPIIFQRFTNYFTPIFALSVSQVLVKGIRSVTINKNVAAALVSFILVIGYGSYYIYLDFYKMWIPYSTVFNPVVYSERYKFFGGGEG